MPPAASSAMVASEPAAHTENTAPAPLGLFALGTTLAIVILQTRGWLQLESWLLILLVVYGSTALILIGWSDWRARSTFGALAYTCAGLYCLSEIALIILPGIGFGKYPSPLSMAAYLGLWALFGSILCAGARPLPLAVQGVFLLFTLHLTLQAFALGLPQPALSLPADLLGLGAAASALYCSVAICLNASRGRSVLPLGPTPPPESSTTLD